MAEQVCPSLSDSQAVSKPFVGFLKLDAEEEEAVVFQRNMYGTPGEVDALTMWGLGP